MPPVPKKIYTKERFFKPKRVIAQESNPLEETDQITVTDWLDVHRICYQASMMGAHLHPATRNRMKRIGCQAGHPDLIIYDSPPLMPEKKGVAIEMKRTKGGVVSDLQKEWQLKLQARGWVALICEGADAAISALERIGY